MATSSTRATVFTVAVEAGVSIASVSRVLNGLPASAAMTLRVREAIDRLGYVPDSAARSLKVGRTGQLAFAVPDIANPVYVAIMRAIEGVAREAGFRLLLHSMGSDPSEEIAVLRSLHHRYVDGLILTPIRVTPRLLKALSETPAPVVVIGNVPPEIPVDAVRTDSRMGVMLAIRHLIASGRRAIGFVNGPVDTVPGAARREGYEAALAEAGLPLTEPLLGMGADFTHEAGYTAARELLTRAKPDALFCANDLIALGALRALREADLSVPDAVAVAGMDDTDLSALSVPSLTTVSLGSAERGRLAASLMIERLADPSLAPRRRKVEPSLIVRESTAAPRTRNRKS